MLPSTLSKTLESANETRPESDEQTLDEDEIYELLGNERRRVSLEQLAESEGERSVSDLSEEVAAEVADADTPAEDIYSSVYISLCQNHLPKLDDNHIVEYDSDEKTVKLAPEFEELEQHWFIDQQPESNAPTNLPKLIGISLVTILSVGAAFVAPSQLHTAILAFVVVVHLTVVGITIGTRASS